jgi:hypothetical protein
MQNAFSELCSVRRYLLDLVARRSGTWSSIQYGRRKNETDHSFIWNKPSRRALSFSNFVGNVPYIVCEGANEPRR